MRALLIIDMQNAYFKDPVLLGQKNTLVRNINDLVNNFQAKNELIVNVKTVHARDESTWTLNMRDDGRGFAFNGDDETQTVQGLNVRRAVELHKDRDSSFHQTTLQELLQQHGVTELVLCGILSHTCIFQTAVDAYAYNYPVTILRKSVGDIDESLQTQAFSYLKSEYRQNII